MFFLNRQVFSTSPNFFIPLTFSLTILKLLLISDLILFNYANNCYYEKDGSEIRNITDEIPFEIPDSWLYARIESLISVQTGASFKKELVSNDKSLIRVLRGGNIKQNDYSFLDNDLFIPINSVSKNILLQENDLITPAVTSLENIGKIARINQNYENVTVGGFVFIYRPFINNEIISKYFLYCFQSPFIIALIKSITKKSGQAFYNLSKERLINLLIPLPPLAEQKRIVKEIEKYEPLIAEYDKLEQESTKLDSEIKDKLKKSILQYAIQGKLVEQNPNDEPASVLLEKIRAEKKAKLGKKYVDSYIYKGDDNCYYEHTNGKDINITDEIPFDIPDNWCWSRFSDIVYFELGKTPDRHNDKFWSNGEFHWCSISDLKERSYIDNTKEKISAIALKEKFNNKLSPKGTLLMSFKLTVGKTSIINFDAVHNEAIISVFPYIATGNITRNFLFNTLGLLIDYVDKTDAIKGSTLNSKKLNEMFVPFPPLAEQKRIVNKIDEMFSKL